MKKSRRWAGWCAFGFLYIDIYCKKLFSRKQSIFQRWDVSIMKIDKFNVFVSNAIGWKFCMYYENCIRCKNSEICIYHKGRKKIHSIHSNYENAKFIIIIHSVNWLFIACFIEALKPNLFRILWLNSCVSAEMSLTFILPRWVNLIQKSRGLWRMVVHVIYSVFVSF